MSRGMRRTNRETPERLFAAVAAAGVTDRRVLDAVGQVPRSAFVPAEHAERAYRDGPIPIPHDQVTTQPSLSAKMIEALALSGQERVLEIGTGYGYQTALLARLARLVITVECFDDLAEQARRNLADQGVHNVRVLVGDGTQGVEEYAPYDAVLVSAAFPEVPPPLVEQLKHGGRLVQPIGSGGADDVALFERSERGLLRRRVVTPAHFVRLYGQYGFPS